MKTGLPNIDAMSDSELKTFAQLGRLGRRAEARAMFPERPRGYVAAREALSGYAWNLIAARSCRLRGDITGAQVYENICERIYESLPAFARW